MNLTLALDLDLSWKRDGNLALAGTRVFQMVSNPLSTLGEAGKVFSVSIQVGFGTRGSPCTVALIRFHVPRGKFREQVVLQSIWGTALSDAVGPMGSLLS